MYKLLLMALLMLWVISLPLYADELVLRDPTMPLGMQESNQPSVASVTLELNAILRGNHRRLALINGQLLRQGEAIKGTDFYILSIKTHSVRVQSNHDTRVLYLLDSKVKK